MQQAGYMIIGKPTILDRFFDDDKSTSVYP